jgi:hypothetical protein
VVLRNFHFQGITGKLASPRGLNIVSMRQALAQRSKTGRKSAVASFAKQNGAGRQSSIDSRKG